MKVLPQTIRVRLTLMYAALFLAAQSPQCVTSLTIGGGAVRFPIEAAGALKDIIEAPSLDAVRGLDARTNIGYAVEPAAPMAAEPDAAVPFASEALELARRRGTPVLIAMSLTALAGALVDRDLQQARALLEQVGAGQGLRRVLQDRLDQRRRQAGVGLQHQGGRTGHRGRSDRGAAEDRQCQRRRRS